jgi:hypothetical protein
VATLAGLRERIRPTAPAGERCLPVLEPLRAVLPEGLRRGTSVAVGGEARVSVLLALLAGASQAGSWVAVVGVPELGLAAAAELGLDLDRLLLVATPPPAQWATVVVALAEAVDVVVAAPRHRVRPADARKLAARVREQGAVLVRLAPVGSLHGDPVGGRAALGGAAPRDPAAGGASGRGAALGGAGPRGQVPGGGGAPLAWPEAADLWCRATVHGWRGVGKGHGHLMARAVTLEVGGRRGAVRPRRVDLWLPDARGGVSLAAAPASASADGAAAPTPARAEQPLEMARRRRAG